MECIKNVSNYSLIIAILAGLGFWAVFQSAGGRAHPRREGEVVILLHGILNRPVFMRKIEKALRRDGYDVVNWGYPSTEFKIEDHAKELDATIKSLKGKRIHFVAFSLGSILARYYLKNYPTGNVGRLVMIAPPNHGSEMVDRLNMLAFFRWIYGDKSIVQLRDSEKEFLIEKCGVPPCEFGIIAGGRGDGKGFNPLLSGDDDGTVSLDSARLPGAKDLIVLPYQHTALIFRKRTADNVLHFLESGKFLHKEVS